MEMNKGVEKNHISRGTRIVFGKTHLEVERIPYAKFR